MLMTAFLPRFFYILAVIAIVLLLWPNPVTLFLAACCSCLTLPIYRRQCRQARCRMRYLRRAWAQGFKRRFCLALISKIPVLGYIVLLVSALVIPVATLVLLVSPQAGAGLARLRELRENNFQLPPHWVQPIRELRDSLPDIPSLAKLHDDLMHNLDAMASDAVGMLVSHSFGFVGGTMNVLWTTFLFLTLTVLFSCYARSIRIIAGRVFRLRQVRLRRFN
ncbi:MAG: AI-2E family transporter, partial [Desulfovibrionaceae bacterium]|nr:AI-2E family transporter [Desulfovibrionaceae bacterium]